LRRLRAAFVVFAAGLAAWTAGASRCHAAAAAPETVTVETVSGPVAGKLLRFGPKEVVIENTEGAERKVELGSVISIGFGEAERPADTKVAAYLANGGGLLCDVTGAGDQHLVLRSAAFGEVSTPISEISGLILPGADPKLRDTITTEITSGTAPLKDRLYLPNGDRMDGIVTKVALSAVTFDGMLGELDYSLSKLAGVIFGSASRRPAKAKGLSVEVSAATGEVLSGVPTGLADGRLTLQTAWGPAARIALGDIRRLAVRGGRAVPLATLKPVRTNSRTLYEGEPRIFPSVSRSGATLIIRPHTTVVFDLAGLYERLTARAGLKQRDGSVSIRMLADGREVLNVAKLTGTDAAKPIDVPLAGARRLVIVCGFGVDQDDAGDALELRAAHLVKPKEAK